MFENAKNPERFTLKSQIGNHQSINIGRNMLFLEATRTGMESQLRTDRNVRATFVCG
jgi:hypothetical protein